MGCRGRGAVLFPCSIHVEAYGFRQGQNAPLCAVELGQGKLGKVNREAALIAWQQADSLSPQDFAEKNVALFPAEYPVALYTAYQHSAGILRLRYSRRILAWRRFIHRGRGLHSQGLVRSHLVV